MISNTRPGLCLIWGAHVHVQRATSDEWIRYLMKYCMKTELKGHMNLTADVATAVGLPEEVSLGTLQGCVAALDTHVISTNEAAWILQQEGLVDFCQKLEFLHVSCHAPQQKYFSKGFGSANRNGKADQRLYFDRPEDEEVALPDIQFDDMCMIEYLENFFVMDKTIVPVGGVIPAKKSEDARFVCLDKRRRPVMRFKAAGHKPHHNEADEKVVVLPIYYPCDQARCENFFFTEILKSVPARSLAEWMCSTENKTGTWAEAAFLNDLFDSDEQVIQHLKTCQTYEWDQFWTDRAITFLSNEDVGPITAAKQAREKQDDRVTNEDAVVDAVEATGGLDQLNGLFKTIANGRQYSPVATPEEAAARESQVMTDPDQAATYTKVMNAVNSKNRSRKRLFRVQGPGGTGKSYLLRASVAKLGSQGVPVIVCCSSAKAARGLGIKGATTAHTAFSMTGNNWVPLTNISVSLYLKRAAVIIIDEISMCLAHFLQAAHERTSQASVGDTQDAGLPFGGKVVVLAGDVHQLPAVCEDKACKNGGLGVCTHQPYHWPMWSLFEECKLTRVHRQAGDAQAPFVDALSEMRAQLPGAQTLEFMQRMVQPAGQPVPWPANPEEAMIIAATNELVDKYNAEQLARFRQVHADAESRTYAAVDNMKGNRRITQQDKEKLVKHMEKATDLADSLSFTIGAPCAIDQNQAITLGVHNGATGRVHSLSNDTVKVQLDDGGRVVSIARASREVKRGGLVFTRKQFPLSLAFARTTFKVQGDTCTGPIFIHAEGFSHPGEAYVAFSRATDYRNITILPAGIQLTLTCSSHMFPSPWFPQCSKPAVLLSPWIP
jgi:ATP-dependent DNA helicase PIF1